MPRKALAVLLLAVFAVLCALPVYAETEEYSATGIVTTVSDNLNCRAAASATAAILTTLPKGSTVSITGKVTVGGALWYRVNVLKDGKTVTGYCMAQYITVYEYKPDADFEAYLTAQKFPESYKDGLRAIHTLHPNWVFSAQHVAVDWNTLLAKESALGVNMVYTSQPDAWKSFEKGAYNWNTGTWVGLDGSSWVAASKELIAYTLDPRNFLTETEIFQFLDLSYDENAVYSKEYVDAVFAPSFLSGTYLLDGKQVSYSQTVLDAGKFSGANPYMLAARLYQEQGVKGNGLAHGTVSGYEGYYNFFNIRAYASGGYSAVTYGAMYAATANENYLRPWDTPYKAICGGAKYIANTYINRGQCTLYLQKYDILDVYGNGTYSHQYMSNVNAPVGEAKALRKVFTGDLLEDKLSFLIPVFDGMPEKAQAEPGKTGNNNNWLDDLTVEGFMLSPVYALYTTEYDLIVDSEVSSVKVSARAKEAAAAVHGTGVLALDYGENRFTVTVTATSGVTRDYILNIYRSGSPPDEKEYTFASELLQDDTFVLPDGTTLEALKAKVETTGYDVYYLNAGDLSLEDSDLLATGCRIALYKGSVLEKTYPVIIPGDSNGDGKVTSVDLLRAQKAILDMVTLTDAQRQAADANRDGKLTSVDLLRTQKYILRIIDAI